jgi:superfamily II DNA or RNA helicase
LVEINIDDWRWRSDDEVSVNKRQYEAIKYMFTNEIAIIQGPPGTGKTFVGVKFI